MSKMAALSAHCDEIAARLVEGLITDGGATVDANNGRPADHSSGYYVSLRGWEWITDGVIPSVCREYAQRVFMETTADYVGAWSDGGRVYLDVTVWRATLSEAIRIGRDNGQIAVWDIVRSTAVPCDAYPLQSEPTAAPVSLRKPVNLRKRLQ